MTIRTVRAAATMAALAATVASHVTGDDAAGPRRARIEFRVLATPEGSGTHLVGSSMSAPLEEGASTAASMQVMPFPASVGSPCRSNIGVTMGPSMAPHGPFPLWQVDATVRRAEMDEIVVAYTWKRRSASTGTVVGGKGEATLTEKGRALLDYVPTWDRSSGCLRNVALELSASIPEDPAFEDRRIAYDLWLVRENQQGSQTRRLQLIGKQGESVAFDYGMFRSKLHGVPLPERPIPTSGVMEMTVEGSVRSRIQADGSIELLLVAHRTARPSDGRWATAAHGEKRVRAAAGETLRLELPPPANFEGADEPETFKAIAEERVALVLTLTLVE
jgi:hypothetical protein